MNINEEKKLPDENYIRKLEAHCDTCKKATEYAITRFDILIIALSSGSLAFTVGLIRDFFKTASKQEIFLLKISCTLFGCAIVINLVSQITSYYSNKIEIKITNDLIKQEKGKICLHNAAKLEKNKTNYNRGTNFCNASSFILFIIGIILLMKFLFIHF